MLRVRDRVICGGTSVMCAPMPDDRAGAGTVTELRQSPADILLRRCRVSVYAAGGRRALISRRMSTSEARSFAADYSDIFRRGDGPCDAYTCASAPFAASVFLCRGAFAAALFAPMIWLLSTRYLSAPLWFILLGRCAAAIVALLPFISVLYTAASGAYANIRRSGGMLAIARGAAVRRILHIPAPSARAEIAPISPVTKRSGANSGLLSIGSIGMIAVPHEALLPGGNGREITRLEYRSADAGAWCVAAMGFFAAVLPAAAHYSQSRLFIASAALPVFLLLLFRALASAALRGRPAAVLCRDMIAVCGLWGCCAVSVRAGRNSIARAAISQDAAQRFRGTCTLTLYLAGTRRPVRCRGVELSRAAAMLPRLYRGQ